MHVLVAVVAVLVVADLDLEPVQSVEAVLVELELVLELELVVELEHLVELEPDLELEHVLELELVLDLLVLVADLLAEFVLLEAVKNIISPLHLIQD